MTFLSPLAAIIGAAISVPILIALYLLKLRRKPLRVSSTLLWEQAVQDLQANVPLRWLRASWLLALQLLALAALLSALARPAVPAPGAPAAKTVIIIDRSASMNATDGVRNAHIAPITDAPPFSRLDQAKSEANRIIADLRRTGGAGGRRGEAMLVALAKEARVIAPFTSDANALLEAVSSVTPTDQTGDLRAALELTRAMSIGLDAELSDAARTRVVLISDGAFDTSGIRQSLPSGMDFVLVPVGPSRPGARPTGPTPDQPAPDSDTPAGDFDNLAIVALAAKRDLENPALARVFVRVENAAPRAIEAGLSLRVNDEPAGVRILTLPPASARADGSITPGQASATFETARAEAALLTVSIARPDRLPADNTASLLLRPVSNARVLVVGPGLQPQDPFAAARGSEGVDRFLLGVLEDLELASLRVMNADAYQTLAASASERSAWDSTADLVIFDRVTPAAMPPRSSISIGASLADGSVLVEDAPGDQSHPGALAPPTRFVLWRRTHPLLQSVPLDSVLISPPMRLTIAEREGQQAADVLARGSAGPLIVLQSSRDSDARAGVRRLVLGFDLLRTNWGPDVSFPVFFAGAVEFLTGRGDAAAGQAWTTDQPVSVTPAPGASELRVRGPVEFAVPVSGSVAPSPNSPPADASGVTLGTLPKTGIYRVEGAGAPDAAVAVNMLSPSESAIDTRTSIRLGPTGARIEERPRSGEPPMREVWHWFVLAAAGLLAIEGVLFARRMRAG